MANCLQARRNLALPCVHVCTSTREAAEPDQLDRAGVHCDSLARAPHLYSLGVAELSCCVLRKHPRFEAAAPEG